MNRKCTTMRTLRKRAAGGPLIPRSCDGLVRFLTLPQNIVGFRYGKHEVATSSCIQLTPEGRKLAEWFHKQIGYEPLKLLHIQDAADLIERSRPFWFSSEASVVE